MASVLSAIQDTVPISQFNRGLAGKIFQDVKKYGSKVVMKNNTAEAVILSPEEYEETQEELNDYRLLTLAVDRMQRADLSKAVGREEMMKRLGITDEDLGSADEVEIE